MTEAITDIENESNSMNDEEIAHLAGFIDGIGTITVRVVKETDYKIGYTLRPVIQLLRADDEDPVLGKLMAYCDEEHVKYNLVEVSHNTADSGKSIRFETTDKDSIERFLSPLMDYLVTNYMDAHLLLEEVLPALRDGKHHEKQGFMEMMNLVDEIRSNGRRESNVKYDREYFEEQWSIAE